MTATNIQAALAQLDPSKDDHWTAEGLPRIDVLKTLASDQALTRETVSAAVPGFSRAVASGAAQQAPGAAPPSTVTPPAANAAPAAPPAPKAAPTPPPVLTADEKAQALVAVETELKDAQADLAEIDKYLSDGNKARAKQSAKVDALLKQVEKLQPVASNSDAIQAYLAQQRTNLAARGVQIQKAAQWQSETGVKLSDLIPQRSKIDAAMARKTGHGLGRPGFKQG